MKTFKQFMQENDPLNDIAIEMWLRNRFGLSHKDAITLRLNLEGKEDSLIGADMFDVMFDAYAGEMPYDVAKGRGDLNPDQWVIDKITDELKQAGLELE